MRTLVSSLSRTISSRAILAVAATIVLGSAFAQQGETVTITMNAQDGQFYFDPVGVHVQPGTTVRFVIENGSHNTVAYAEENGKPQRIPEDAQAWSSQIGEDFEITLSAEGVYDFYCLPHESLGMVGRIVVGDPAASPAKDPSELSFDAASERLPTVEAILAQEDGELSFAEASSD